MSSVPVLSPQPGHSLSPTDLRAGLLASEGSIPASPSAASTISDHVLAQHYTRSLTGRYSSKDPGWNYYMHFYTRFSTTHTFVLSSLYAWTSVHLYCTGNLSSRANALTHYQKAISEIRNAYGLELLAEDIQYQAQMVVSGVGKEDLDAIAVAMYFLASTDLMLSRAINLRWILQFEAGLIRARMPTSFETLFSQIATWFCFLDSRASAFGATESQVIVAIGGEAGLLEAMDRSRYLLQREYNLLYPPKEQQRDRAHTPLLKLTNRLRAGHILPFEDSISYILQGLRCMNEDTASNGKVLSTYLTTMMLFHCLEIYYSRTFEPGAPLYSADDHASNLITTVNKYYQLLKYPQTEPPPTKFWPIPLVMAAIEARDPIYRDWARRRIQDYKNAGEHYARSVEFADKVQRSEEKKSANSLATYQHIIVEGLPYDRGFSHGSQVKEKIHTNVAYYKLPGKLPDMSICSRIISESYIPALKKYYPTGLEELQGIADGAGLPLDDIVLLNARYDLGRCMYRLLDGGKTPQHGDNHNVATETAQDVANECTSGFFSPEATVSGESLAVHNWDMSNHLHEKDLVVYLEVHPHPSEDRPAMFILTEVGQLIRSGMNSAGLAVTANSLLTSVDYVPVSHIDASGEYQEVETKLVLPISLVRRVFLEYRNFSEGLVAISSYPRHVSGNLHVSTADGFAIGLEAAPDRIYKFYGEIDDNYVIHSNHFLSPAFMGRDDVYDRYPGGSSWFRARRAEKGTRKHARAGALTPELIRTAFSDHLSYPESLCSHPNFKQKNTPSNVLTGYTSKLSMTVAFVIYNLNQKTITVCKGPPCQGVLEYFKLEER
ncbi:hypothetical protein BX600DRAFT_374941 [Xylariales sp. PMI_506]|nr:hypothetical protein BX600DRAFT_374941 [Xylariales sp. PMI_506]